MGLSALSSPSPVCDHQSMGHDEEHAMTILTRQECLDLLSQVSAGRVGVSIDALPVILPVHFVLFGESVLFNTIPGTKFDAATNGAVVAFQADAREARRGAHWSVLLQGIASEVSNEWHDARAISASIKPWGGGARERRLVRVDASHMTGRRFQITGERQELGPPAPPFPSTYQSRPDHTGTDRRVQGRVRGD